MIIPETKPRILFQEKANLKITKHLIARNKKKFAQFLSEWDKMKEGI